MKTGKVITTAPTLFFILFSFGLGILSVSASSAQPLEPSYTIESFPVGNYPSYLTFDGANVWVTNGGPTSSVTKLRASDGERLGVFPVAKNPAHLTFDGENIWVACDNGNAITKLRASDRALLGTFPMHDLPTGIAWDGANIWVSHMSKAPWQSLRVTAPACSLCRLAPYHAG
jgi:hypothetical protein